jgi:hypothetical protein
MAPERQTTAADNLAAEYLDELGIDVADFDGWKVEVATRAGRDVGVVVTKGTEIHIVSRDPT